MRKDGKRGNDMREGKGRGTRRTKRKKRKRK